MRVIDTGHWTADFQLARACWEVYERAPRDGIHVVCLGDPGYVCDRVVVEVGGELRRYHPYVYGTPSRPVNRQALPAEAERHLEQWGRGFLIAIAAGWSDEHAGRLLVIDADREGLGVQPPDWMRQPPEPAVPLTRDGAGVLQGGDPGDSADGRPPDDEGWLLYPDVIIVPVVARPDGEGNVIPLGNRALARCRDTTIDGILRLYFKSGWDHTLYRHRNRLVRA